MADGDPLPVPVGEIGLMGLYAALLVGSVVMVARRRHLQPLLFRDAYLLIATVTSTFFANLITFLSLMVEHRSCFIEVSAYLPFVAMVVLLSARFWKLLLAYEITHARVSQKFDSWILRHPWLSSSTTIWQASGLLIAALFLMFVVMILSSPDCAENAVISGATGLLAMLYWLAVAIMTWKLRRVQDGFFVVRELKMLGPVLLITNIILIVITSDKTNRFPVVPIAISSIIQLMIQMWYPLWKSYVIAQGKHHETTSSLPTRGLSMSEAITMPSSRMSLRNAETRQLTRNSTFLEILRHPEGFEAMKQFLTLEFSIENLLCWQLLHEHKRERQPDQVEAHFRTVYETYIRKGSLNEVNINAQLKKHFDDVYRKRPVDIEEIMKMRAAKSDPAGASTPGHDADIKLRLLKELHKEMVKLMQLDSFQRFRRSAEYDLLVRADPEQGRTASTVRI